MEIVCPHCGKRLNPWPLMGKAGAGKKRRISEKQRRRRREWLAHARKLRWKHLGGS